jgi:hypothetical protein
MWTCEHCGEEVKGHFVECSKCGHVRGSSPTEGDVVAVTPPTQDTETSHGNAPMFYVLSALAIVAAVIFAGMGLYKLYDDSYTARVVGGDAYNFIIYGTRGTAYVCAGIVCAVLSVTFALFAHTARTAQN